MLILLASFYFYAYWKAAYVLVLAAPAVIDYWCAIRIEETPERSRRLLWLRLSIVSNLALLAWFKYTNFFLDTVASVFHLPVRHLDIILPIGISFFTFKLLSYTVDVYRGMPACRSMWQYLMFASYFPELIAGPIVRASVFLPQMTRSLRPSWRLTIIGLQIVLQGVTKKLLIADRMAEFVDPVFNFPALYSPLTVASAVLAYGLQIYCDFSGYSDIAIGISKIIGFDLPENFNMPYISTSVVEFWRRWHITLSNWLRDYLFFSMGGLRTNPLNRYRNTLLTMLIGGLWHGASWNFVVWGGLHGVALCINHWYADFRRQKRRQPSQAWPARLASWAVTFAFVNIAWVFFRSPNFQTTGVILKKLFWLDRTGVDWFYSPLVMVLPVVIAGHWFGLMASRQSAAPGIALRRIPPPAWLSSLYAAMRNRFALKPSEAAGIYVLLPGAGFSGALVLTVWLLALYLFGAVRSSPFIYFQF